MNIFVIDGSALTAETLMKREVAMKVRLIREYFQYKALIRTATNTIRGIKEHSNKIADFITLLPLHSILLADPEFDVEENYRDAEEGHIDLQVKQKKGEVRKSRRKAARDRFNKKEYGMRKLGEHHLDNHIPTISPSHMLLTYITF